MKIGILTFHRAHNYGAVLQCYALQEVLKGMGHDVWIIDYRQANIEQTYKIFKIRNFLRRNILFGFIYLLRFFHRYKTKRKFENFRSKHLKLTEPIHNISELKSNIDAFVVGSDQLWNTGCTGGIDNVFFGRFDKYTSKLIGYAISGNLKSISKIEDSFIRDSVNHFDAISFRELKFAETVSKKANISFPIVVDPTLLANSILWDNIIDDKWSKKKYVVLYEVRLRVGKRNSLRDLAKQYAKENNFELIDLSSNKYSPSEFVSIIKYAHLVITSSYHATAFSLIFNTPICAYILEDGDDDRYVNLLREFRLEKNILKKDEKPFRLEYTIDETAWNQLKVKSLEYLNTNL